MSTVTTAYSKLLSLLAAGSLDWAADDVRVLLVDSTYTYDPAHAFVADISGELAGGGYARVALTGKAVTDDAVNGWTVFDADDPVFAALGAAVATPAGAVLIKFVTNDADSPLLAFHPLLNADAPTGGDYTILIPAEGFFRLRKGASVAVVYTPTQNLDITVAGTPVRSATQLAAGVYTLTSELAIYVGQGGSTVTVDETAADGNANAPVAVVGAGGGLRFEVTGASDGYISVKSQDGATLGRVFIAKES